MLFVGCWTSLTFLQLTTNALASIPEEIGNLVDLEVLDVARNRISHVPSTLMQCARLRVLLLNRNRLRTFPSLAMPALEEFVREFCVRFLHAKRANYAFFYRLNLSNNKIEKLPTLDLPKLRELNLSKNRLRELPPGIFGMNLLLSIDTIRKS